MTGPALTRLLAVTFLLGVITANVIWVVIFLLT